MSLLTQCPACNTIYRVVPDQLRISEGWVKCGQCSEIFDASKQLMETATVVPPSTEEDSAPPDTALDQDNDHLPQAEVQVMLESSTTIAEPEPEPETISEAPLQMRWDDHPSALESDSEDDAKPAEEPPLPSFLAQKASGQYWQRSWVRGVLAVIVLVLGVGLVGQWLDQEKDRLATQHPELNEALVYICNLTKCTIEPLKRIESLSVDSAAFSPLGKDSYRLNFVVKNSSTLALATPDVELSLTDAQDHAVYRRIFNSKELGEPYGKVIAAGAEKQVSLAFRVASDTTEMDVRGYRLLIFYP